MRILIPVFIVIGLFIGPGGRSLQQGAAPEVPGHGAPEIALVNGKEKDLSSRFDRPAADAIFSALLKGHIDPREIGGPMARFIGGKSSVAERREKLCKG